MENKAEKIELVDIDSIVGNPKNPNHHPQDQIERLAKLIKNTGFRSPLIISKRSGFLVVGHGRLDAAKKLGLKEVPVIYQDFENEAEEYSFVVADNAIGSWSALDHESIRGSVLEFEDFDVELLGMLDFELIEVEQVEGKCDEDEVPEVIHPITRKGDLWILGNHRLLCGDSTMIDDVERLMGGEKAGILITDPPYNYGSETGCSKSNTGSNQLKDASWDKGFLPSTVPFFDFLSESYSAYIFTSAFLFGETFSIAKEFSDFSGMMCWKKTTYNSNLIKNYPTWNIEPIVYATKGKHTFNYDKSDAKNALLEFAGEHSSRFMGHPSQKPIKMLESIIKNSSNDSAIVLDLFLGSGSTLIACEKTNRKCFGMELDEHYCDVIINRWQNYTGKKAVLESTGQTYEDLKLERQQTE